MGDRTDNWEELVQSQENRLYRAADDPFIRGVFAASPSESGTSSGLEPSPGGGGQGEAGFHSFLVEGPEAEGTSSLPAIPYINYQSVDGRSAVNADLSRHFLEGSFSVDLTKEEVQNIFWGPAGRPEGVEGDLPWMLFWGGYTLSGSALYSGEGELLWVTLQGDNTDQEISFTLTLRPGELRGLHGQRVEPPQGHVAQNAHARMMERQTDVEHDGRQALLAKMLAGFHEHVPRAADDILPGRIVVGDVEGGPEAARFLDELRLGMHGHHARFPRGAGFQFRHVLRAGVEDVPGRFRLVDPGKAKGDELAETVPAHQGRSEPQRGQMAPLGVFQQKEIGLLPAGEADLFLVPLVQQGKDVPVGHGGQTVHGRPGGRELIVELASHARPDAALAAAHDCQFRCRRTFPGKPDAPCSQRGKFFG